MATDSTNSTSIDSLDEPEGDYYNLGSRIGLSCWLGVISFFGFFGNVIVILAVICFPKLRTITNVYITSLAVNDMLLSLIIPWLIVGIVSVWGWTLPPWTCIAVAILRFGCSGSSVWHLVAIGLNRMILITMSSTTYQKVYTPINTALIVVVTWLIPFSVIIVPYAVGATRLGYDSNPHLCSDLEDNPDGTTNLTHTYLAWTFLTCIPLAIVLLLYLRIYVHVRQHVKKQNAWAANQHQQPPQQQQQPQQHEVHQKENDGNRDAPSTARSGERERSNPGSLRVDGKDGEGGNDGSSRQNLDAPASVLTRQNPTAAAKKPAEAAGRSLENRVTKNTFYVVLGFILCVVPYGIFVHWRIGPKKTPMAQAFILFNACMNPLIYGTKHPHFRGAIRNIFKGKFSGPVATATSTVSPGSQNQQTAA